MFIFKNALYLEVLLIVGLWLFRSSLAAPHRRMVGLKTTVLVTLVPIFGLFGQSVYIFYGYLFCTVAFTSRTREELCGTYLLMLPMMPALSTTINAGDTLLINTSSFISVNVGALVGMLLTRGRARRNDIALDISALAILLIFSFIDARDISATAVLRHALQWFLLTFPPYLLASRSVITPEQLRRVLTYLCLAAFLGAITALFNVLRQWDLYEPFYASLNLEKPLQTTYLSVRNGFLRTGGPFLDYSAFGILLAMMLSILPSLRGLFTRWGHMAVCTVLLGAIVATQSRGAWLALGVGYIISLAFRKRGVAAIGFAVVAVALVAFRSSYRSMTASADAASETADYRRQLLKRGFEQVQAHPFFGQSPSDLVVALPDLVQGQHIVDFVNFHLFVAMAAGVPAFLIWLAIWPSTFARVSARRLGGEPWIGRSAILGTPAIMIAVVVVALIFTSGEERNLVWPMLALGFAHVPLRRGMASATAERARSPLLVAAPVLP